VTGDGEPGTAAPAAREPSLVVNEVYASVQGESSYAGVPCAFLRLTGCALRCTWCDSEFTFYQGRRRLVADVLKELRAFGLPLVEVTGGEPLLQKAVHPLITALLDEGRTVLVETGGDQDISAVDPRAVVIMDVKAPGSGMADKMDWGNLDRLRPHHEVKFVLADRADYEWARDLIRAKALHERARLLMGCVFGVLEPRDLAGWILEDRLPVRCQLQRHTLIWQPTERRR
jgi:7-carboxy-7-deazaguanine synthase